MLPLTPLRRTSDKEVVGSEACRAAPWQWGSPDHGQTSLSSRSCAHYRPYCSQAVPSRLQLSLRQGLPAGWAARVQLVQWKRTQPAGVVQIRSLWYPVSPGLRQVGMSPETPELASVPAWGHRTRWRMNIIVAPAVGAENQKEGPFPQS